MDNSGDKAIKTFLATYLGAGKVFMDSSGDKAIKTLFAAFLGAGKVFKDSSGDKAIKTACKMPWCRQSFYWWFWR